MPVEGERGTIDAPETAGRRPGIGRALVIGFLLVIASALAIPYLENYLSTSSTMESHFPLGILIPFVLLVTVYNLAAKLLHPRLVLRTEELIVVLIVGLPPLLAQGIVPRLIATIASPYYFGTPENRWPDLVWPILPKWLLPGNPVDNRPMVWFYDGLPKDVAEPWSTWGPALTWWLLFVGVIIFVCLCISVILRRQWVEYERVEFPLAQIPLQLALSAGRRERLPGVFRQRLFWFGFAVPAVLIVWRILSWFYPAVPHIGLGLDMPEIELGPDFPEPIYGRVNFLIIGFAYFTRLEILLSLWLFQVLGLVQAGVSRSLGFGLEEETAYVGDQTQGGLFFFVLWGLWMGRKHLRQVFRKAFTGARDVDDTGEYLSYRTAVFGLILGGAFLMLWMVRMGMHVGSAAVMLLAMFVIYLGLAKIISMSGLIYLRPTWSAQSTFRPFVTSADFGPGSIVGTNLLYAVRGQDKGFVMPSMMTVGALNGVVRRHGRTMGMAILTATILAVSIHAVTTIRMAYGRGAGNFHTYVFTRAGPTPYNYMATALRTTDRPRNQGTRRVFFFVGMGLTAFLTGLNYRFPWWPLHPVGVTVAWGWPVHFSAMSIFVAWLIKAIILRIGGLSLYRRGQPFFIGLVVGTAAGVFLGALVDGIWFPGQGHDLLGGGD